MLNVSNNFKTAVYAPERKTTARVKFTLNGTTTLYDDSYIIGITILEEMDTLNVTMPANEIKVTFDNTSGEFSFLNMQNMQEIIASRPKIEVEFGLYLKDETIEWVPMGTYFLINWKNEIASMSISLIGRDHFDNLAEISYNNKSGGTLYNLAVDVLQKAGITTYSIDDSLKNISTSGFIERLDSRSALQNIGIASRCAVLQDRYGAIIIKPFKVLDASDNFLAYCGQPNAFSGMVYPAVHQGFDMKNIEYDNIFEEPEVSLDKTIYEVVINIYESTGVREVIYINSSINGNNGSSFKIDNPLINTQSLADSVAAWIIRESNFNAVYKTIWRQNPILECSDVILVEDSFQAKKQTRVFKQEFVFEGYLRGYTESRGGI